MEMKIYKNGMALTPEQEAEVVKLINTGMGEAARDYMQHCMRENHTDEYKAILESGMVEGFGVDVDF